MVHSCPFKLAPAIQRRNTVYFIRPDNKCSERRRMPLISRWTAARRAAEGVCVPTDEAGFKVQSFCHHATPNYVTNCSACVQHGLCGHWSSKQHLQCTKLHCRHQQLLRCGLQALMGLRALMALNSMTEIKTKTGAVLNHCPASACSFDVACGRWRSCRHWWR